MYSEVHDVCAPSQITKHISVFKQSLRAWPGDGIVESFFSAGTHVSSAALCAGMHFRLSPEGFPGWFRMDSRLLWLDSACSGLFRLVLVCSSLIWRFLASSGLSGLLSASSRLF